MTGEISSFADAGRFEVYCHYSPPTEYPEESHDTLQVCVPLEGALYRVVRSSETGRMVVQNHGSRDVLVVPVGQPHAVLWRRSADVVSVQLCRPFITQALGVEGLSLRDTFTVRDAFISAAALQLRAALRADVRVSPAFAEAMATAIAYRVAVAGSSSGGNIRTTDRAAALSAPQLARVIGFIDEHLDEPITLARLADLLGMSTWHFMRRFKASQGVSPHAFITERRLDRAQVLLATSKLSISEIALEVGLSDSHFSRTFLAGVRLSPRGVPAPAGRLTPVDFVATSAQSPRIRRASANPPSSSGCVLIDSHSGRVKSPRSSEPKEKPKWTTHRS